LNSSFGPVSFSAGGQGSGGATVLPSSMWHTWVGKGCRPSKMCVASNISRAHQGKAVRPDNHRETGVEDVGASRLTEDGKRLTNDSSSPSL